MAINLPRAACTKYFSLLYAAIIVCHFLMAAVKLPVARKFIIYFITETSIPHKGMRIGHNTKNVQTRNLCAAAGCRQETIAPLI